MTTIEWTDETWNPTTGCHKVSPGCKNCYAKRLFPRVYPGREFEDVRTHPERIEAPLHWKKPRRVFVDSMSDLFHKDVPDDFIFDVFSIMERAHWHTFQVLTKRPERMQQLLGEPVEAGEKGPPPNIWWGVSVEDQATADERIPLLLQTPAAVRFLSCEPLLGPLNIRVYLDKAERFGMRQADPCVDWVIAGGESGPKARPSHPNWFRSLRDQCAAADVAYFFKQWGEWSPSATLWTSRNKLAQVGIDGSFVIDPGQANKSFLQLMYRVGKKAAGRTLDGRTHDDYPEAP